MTTVPGQVYEIAVLPGDGIGKEVMAACLEVLRALESRGGGPRLRLTTHEAGAQYYARSGVALPTETLDACRRADAILFGAMGWPDFRLNDGTEIAPQLDLRIALDLYAGVRPIRWFPGLPRVLADPRAEQTDFVLVREQTEGLFHARGRGVAEGDEAVLDTMRISRAGTRRVSEFAFGLAARRPAEGRRAKVTCVDKANVFASMAFFRRVFDEVAHAHPEIAARHAYVDAMALTMVKQPWTLEVLVTENMFGDILSDLGAGLIGGMGMAPSADIGDRHGLFQPAHGSAPDIAGQDKANPCAMFLSAAMMLDWLAHTRGDAALAEWSAALKCAVEITLSRRTAVPLEYGGSAGTNRVAEAVIGALGEAFTAGGLSAGAS